MILPALFQKTMDYIGVTGFSNAVSLGIVDILGGGAVDVD
jgi:hypothetical protein